MKEKMKPEKRAMKAASDARENSSYTDDTTNILIGKNVWKYFEKRGWYSGVITRAEKNEEGIVTYNAKYEDEKEESNLSEDDVKKWCSYAEMDPRPRGPLILLEKLAATASVAVLDKEASAGALNKLPSLCGERNGNVVNVDESPLSEVQYLSSAKVSDTSIEQSDEAAKDSSVINPETFHKVDSHEEIIPFSAETEEHGNVLYSEKDVEFVADSGNRVMDRNESDSVPGYDQVSDAIVEHSAPGGTIGEAIASSNNPRLGFDNPYSGLHEIIKINQEFRLPNADRRIMIANRGATTNVPAYKDSNKFIMPQLDFNNQDGQEPGNLIFCLAELARKPKDGLICDGAISRGCVYLSSVQRHVALFEKELTTKYVVYVHGFFSEMAGANNKSFFGGGNHIVASVIDSSGTIFSDDEIMSSVVIMNSRWN